MTVLSLTPEQESLVADLLGSGGFADAGHVVTEGLRLLKALHALDGERVAELENAIDIGLASGPAVVMEAADELIARFRRHA